MCLNNLSALCIYYSDFKTLQAFGTIPMRYLGLEH